MAKARRTLGLITCASGVVYAALLFALAAWAFTAGADAPIRSPYTSLLGAVLLGGTLAWTGVAVLKHSPWAMPASTLAAGVAGGLVLVAFALELVWRWQHPLDTTGGPPLQVWPVIIFLAWPAAQHLLVRVFGVKPKPSDD